MNESVRSPRVRRGGTVASAQRNRRTLPNRPEFARVQRLVADGTSLREITRTTGVKSETVKRYFPQAGWPVGAPKGQAQLRKLERAVFGEGRA